MKTTNENKKTKPQTNNVVEKDAKQVKSKLKLVSYVEKPIVLNYPITLPDDNPKRFEVSRGNMSIEKVYDMLYLENPSFSYDWGQERKKDLNDAGIKSIKQFVEAGMSKTTQIMKCSSEAGCKIYYNTLSLYQNRIIKIKEPSKLTDNPVYIKIQTGGFQAFIIIITIYISKTNELIQLIASNKDEEIKIAADCLEILNKYKDEDIITYPSSGMLAVFRILLNKLDDIRLKHDHLKFIDAGDELNNSFVFPIEKYFTIYNLAIYFGYKFKNYFKDEDKKYKQEFNDAKCIYFEDIFKTTEFKRLRECNKDDLMSLVGIIDYLYFKA